ncbi:MAG: alkaline phosphatase family protein, partial [Actinomycetota bacterium]
MDRTAERNKPTEAPARRGGGGFEVLGAISALVALALAQPLFDLLSRNAEFFVARRSPVLDVVLFALGVAMVLPGLLAAVVVVTGRIHKGAGQVAFVTVLAALGTLLALRIFKQAFAPSGNGTLILGAAVTIGAALAWAVWSSDSFRSLLRWGPVLAVAVTVWFLTVTPLSQIVFPRDVALADAGGVDRPADVVILILDELPLATLLDQEHEIDERLFPNFARLAASSDWYRNATTVDRGTALAVPAILDGQYPREGALPTAADYPHNIFTLLGSDYQVEAEELVTRLCPTQVCNPSLPPFERRMRSLASDVSLITAHMLLPEDLTRDLPPVDENWGDFATQDTAQDVAGIPGVQTVLGKGDPPSETRAFIDAIRPRPGPQLYLKHILLPHSPWRYLPEGYQYPQSWPILGTVPIPNHAGTRWGEDRWLIAQAYQSHILQTMVADRLVGDLLDRLNETGMYRHAVVVVVADHGTAFVPGAARRSTAIETIGSIAPIPLFIKEPGQSGGRVIDA